MGIFEFDEQENGYIAEINYVKFFCRTIKDGYVEKAERLADAYPDQIYQIVEYIADEVRSTFGYMSRDEIAEGLGVPTVNLDTDMISYLEQTLDDCHIIDVEFGGLFDEFYSMSIDG